MKRCLALVALLLGLPHSGTAQYVQKIVPVTQAALPEPQQERATKALVAAQPDLAAFLARFPDATHRVWKAKPDSPRTHVYFSAKLREEYLINLWYDVAFDPGFTRVIEARISHFGVVELERLRHLKSGQVLRPLRFSGDELRSFCADPDAAIARKTTAQH